MSLLIPNTFKCSSSCNFLNSILRKVVLSEMLFNTSGITSSFNCIILDILIKERQKCLPYSVLSSATGSTGCSIGVTSSSAILVHLLIWFEK